MNNLSQNCCCCSTQRSQGHVASPDKSRSTDTRAGVGVSDAEKKQVVTTPPKQQQQLDVKIIKGDVYRDNQYGCQMSKYEVKLPEGYSLCNQCGQPYNVNQFRVAEGYKMTLYAKGPDGQLVTTGRGQLKTIELANNKRICQFMTKDEYNKSSQPESPTEVELEISSRATSTEPSTSTPTTTSEQPHMPEHVNASWQYNPETQITTYQIKGLPEGSFLRYKSGGETYIRDPSNVSIQGTGSVTFEVVRKDDKGKYQRLDNCKSEITLKTKEAMQIEKIKPDAIETKITKRDIELKDKSSGDMISVNLGQDVDKELFRLKDTNGKFYKLDEVYIRKGGQATLVLCDINGNEIKLPQEGDNPSVNCEIVIKNKSEAKQTGGTTSPSSTNPSSPQLEQQPEQTVNLLKDVKIEKEDNIIKVDNQEIGTITDVKRPIEGLQFTSISSNGYYQRDVTQYKYSGLKEGQSLKCIENGNVYRGQRGQGTIPIKNEPKGEVIHFQVVDAQGNPVLDGDKPQIVEFVRGKGLNNSPRKEVSLNLNDGQSILIDEKSCQSLNFNGNQVSFTSNKPVTFAITNESGTPTYYEYKDGKIQEIASNSPGAEKLKEQFNNREVPLDIEINQDPYTNPYVTEKEGVYKVGDGNNPTQVTLDAKQKINKITAGKTILTRDEQGIWKIKGEGEEEIICTNVKLKANGEVSYVTKEAEGEDSNVKFVYKMHTLTPKNDGGYADVIKDYNPFSLDQAAQIQSYTEFKKGVNTTRNYTGISKEDQLADAIRTIKLANENGTVPVFHLAFHGYPNYNTGVGKDSEWIETIAKACEKEGYTKPVVIEMMHCYSGVTKLELDAAKNLPAGSVILKSQKNLTSTYWPNVSQDAAGSTTANVKESITYFAKETITESNDMTGIVVGPKDPETQERCSYLFSESGQYAVSIPSRMARPRLNGNDNELLKQVDQGELSKSFPNASGNVAFAGKLALLAKIITSGDFQDNRPKQ